MRQCEALFSYELFNIASFCFSNASYKLAGLGLTQVTLRNTCASVGFGFSNASYKLAGLGLTQVALRNTCASVGAHILPVGWNLWKGDAMFPDKERTAYYAEYKNTGAGAGTAERVEWSKQLSDEEVKQYTVKNILGGVDGWEPVGVR